MTTISIIGSGNMAARNGAGFDIALGARALPTAA